MCIRDRLVVPWKVKAYHSDADYSSRLCLLCLRLVQLPAVLLLQHSEPAAYFLPGKSVTVLDWLSACTCFAWVLARGVVLFVRPHLSLLVLLGLPVPATATLADRAIVSTVGLVILVLFLPEPVRGNWRGPPHGFFVIRIPSRSCAFASLQSARECESRWRHSG